MNTPKLYRTVSVKAENGVKGRLPEKEDFYQIFYEGNKYPHTAKFENKCFMSDGLEILNVTHWLEEVELPSENDKKNMMASIHLDNYQRRIFSAGAKWMRDLIFKNEVKMEKLKWHKRLSDEGVEYHSNDLFEITKIEEGFCLRVKSSFSTFILKKLSSSKKVAQLIYNG